MSSPVDLTALLIPVGIIAVSIIGVIAGLTDMSGWRDLEKRFPASSNPGELVHGLKFQTLKIENFCWDKCVDLGLSKQFVHLNMEANPFARAIQIPKSEVKSVYIKHEPYFTNLVPTYDKTIVFELTGGKKFVLLSNTELQNLLLMHFPEVDFKDKSPF
ncbi:MAG TPA: hypothetical protein V6C89_09215 [Drouetiella sp.]|jgi:hypothetical protein